MCTLHDTLYVFAVLKLECLSNFNTASKNKDVFKDFNDSSGISEYRVSPNENQPGDRCLLFSLLIADPDWTVLNAINI